VPWRLSLTILHDDCWVLQPKWLPYNTMLSRPMAAASLRAGAGKGVAVGAQPTDQALVLARCSVQPTRAHQTPERRGRE